MLIAFGTKAETLERLAPVLTAARVLPQYRFRLVDWSQAQPAVLAGLRSGGWFARPVIVRSSTRQEDRCTASLAGKFVSVPDVWGEEAVIAAVERVLRSYEEPRDEDQVFVQPLLQGAAMRGVAFGLEPNTGGPYVVVNYEWSGRAGAVSSGISSDDHTFYWFKGGNPPAVAPLAAVVRLMSELEQLLGIETLDIEFAWADGELYLFQVRPLVRLGGSVHDRAEVGRLLQAVAGRVRHRAGEFPQLPGSGIALGVMPDWNPAEMIGLRPRPLAASLYRECITDRVWAEQRRRYGYRDVVGVPLMECLGGQPFIDVRASFTSFVPAALDDDLAGKLVDHYLAGLRAHPELHDKVEMELVLHCWTFDLSDRLRDLAADFTVRDRDHLAEALRDLTVRVMDTDHGPWPEDRARLARFADWLDTWPQAGAVELADLGFLLRACIDGGARPFAGLARAGFIATCLLRSLVRVGLWSEEDEARFLRGLQTVVSRIRADRSRLSLASFLHCYGHLRPGTYDILVPRYDEAPARYTWRGPP